MAKSARVDVRMSEDHKELLDQAAAATGQPLSAFMISTLLREARHVLEEERTTKLSRRDFHRLLQIIDSDEPPPRPLVLAARRLRRRYGL